MAFKDLAKTVLGKVGLLEPTRKLVRKRAKKKDNIRLREILEGETQFSCDSDPNAIDARVGRIKFSVHGVEKIFVKNPSAEPYQLCFSILSSLDGLLGTYPDYPHDSDVVKEALGACHMMLERAGDGDSKKAELEKKLSDVVGKHGLSSVEPRHIVIETQPSSDVAWSDFPSYKRFVSTRHSIRQMKEDEVSMDVVRDIVSVAQICPSACNRQPIKVYLAPRGTKMRKLYPDPSVSKDVHNLFVVTVNRAYYSSSEALQPWIDGGIFLESLVMAIHGRGLGSCLFQCLKGTKRYNEVKELVVIPEHEDIVAFVGFGYLPDECEFISTHRKGLDEVLVVPGGGRTHLIVSTPSSIRRLEVA